MILDQSLYQFQKPSLSPGDVQALERASMRMRSDILELIAAAGSGHIGGSYSTLDALLLTYVCGRLSPANADAADRDRVVVSHGHISPAVYTVLADFGYLPKADLFRDYRRVPGLYEGHPSIAANGVDWGSGSLGQGLSVGCGMALAAKMRGDDAHTFVFLGDGEHDKGQLTEAMALAAKYRLGNLTAIVDYNNLQCTGAVDAVLPMDLPARYAAYGWNVLTVDGHDFAALYAALRTAYAAQDKPCAVIARTIMGKGLPFIENNCKYHGSFLNEDQLAQARAIFAPYTDDDLPVIEKRLPADNGRDLHTAAPTVPLVYDAPVACRTAAGNALVSIGEQVPPEQRPVVIDCDVAPSTGTAAYMAKYPDRAVQCGIAEHNAMSVAGAVSVSGLTALFSTFAVFSLGEPYGQLRSNNMNRAPVKILATHCGLDVGPDGKTHQCIDYIGLCANLFDFELIIPADANQTDRAMRYLISAKSAGALATGRSVAPIIAREDGAPFFGRDYNFRYGEADWIRRGTAATVVSYGTLLPTALEAVERLRCQGIDCGLLNVSCPLALDVQKLAEAAKRGPIITFEDHNVQTGVGVRIAALLLDEQLTARLVRIGLHRYGGSAKASDLYRRYELDADTLGQTVKRTLNETAESKGQL